MPPRTRRVNPKGPKTKAVEQLAEALDVPAEMLTSDSDVSHWGAHAPLAGPDAVVTVGAGGPRLAKLPASARQRSTPPAIDPDWGLLAQDALQRAQSAPVPSSYKAEWWPAHVRFPDLEKPARLAKVYATPQGLYVYVRCPGQMDRATGGTPFWYAPLLYDKTPRPATGYAARNAGIALFTEVGQVTLTVLGSCGCSNGSLRAWRPQWADRNEAWEA
jgi:hypothetical protein